MFDENILCSRIKVLRRQNGLTQEGLGRAVGVSKQAVQQWENRIRLPSLASLYALSQYFSVTTDYLLGLEDEPGTLATDVKKDE